MARKSGPTKFNELVTEALSRAEIFGAHDDARTMALRAPSGLRLA